jgi:acyl-CoA thioesterase
MESTKHEDSYIIQDRFARNLGIELVRVENEFARCELEINENHKNGLGSLHGAVIFAIADIAFAAACNSVRKSIGMQADIKYLGKPKGGRLIAEAKIVSASNRIGHYQVSVMDSDGTHVARFSSISYRFPEIGSTIL